MMRPEENHFFNNLLVYCPSNNLHKRKNEFCHCEESRGGDDVAIQNGIASLRNDPRINEPFIQ